jgi:dTDP-L-rhamnose 4-epimerase
MKVLITGGAGFIGSHTVDLLLSRGYKVRILDALLPPVHENGKMPAYVPIKDIEFIHGDVRDRSAWESALAGVEIVVHLAAYQDYLMDFSTFFHTNTVSTALLYEVIVARKAQIRKVVVASSQAAYGEAAYRCPDHQELQYPALREESGLKRRMWNPRCPKCGGAVEPDWTPESVVNPHNQYAISKYTQELVALNLGRRFGIPTVAMRYSIVQGSRQSFRNAYSGVLRIFAQRILNGIQPVCYEDGQQLRDYVSVHDVTQANLKVIEDERADFQCFNVGGDRRVSVLEYAGLVAARAGVKIEPLVPGLYRFGDTRHVFSDVSKLRKTGWEPRVPLEDVVDEYLAWVLEQPDFRDYSLTADQSMLESGTIRKADQP